MPGVMEPLGGTEDYELLSQGAEAVRDFCCYPLRSLDPLPLQAATASCPAEGLGGQVHVQRCCHQAEV